MMNSIRFSKIALGLVGGALLAGPALAHDRHDDRGHDRYQHHHRIGGKGADDLMPWLRNTPEGQRWVLGRYDRDGNGRINESSARDANRAFMRLADRNGDRRLTRREIDRGLDHISRYGWGYADRRW